MAAGVRPSPVAGQHTKKPTAGSHPESFRGSVPPAKGWAGTKEASVNQSQRLPPDRHFVTQWRSPVVSKPAPSEDNPVR
ncbi:MAG: hypothetical protein RIE86_10485 [Imperialibacter sp.]|uniref:hypothetical protein n=1 Tax=Imperialibacter sp. TaxID=2038411 RepID=UPI0032ECDDB5